MRFAGRNEEERQKLCLFRQDLNLMHAVPGYWQLFAKARLKINVDFEQMASVSIGNAPGSVNAVPSRRNESRASSSRLQSFVSSTAVEYQQRRHAFEAAA